ncbi:MAG: hypothetical protein RIT25_1317 [Planctomycetota bacterium]|jgi:predicted PurR-regulated permease PerM
MNTASTDLQGKTLPPPWDRIFSLGTKVFVWGLLVAILYILRQFLLLVFLTFVFAYIQAIAVDGLAHRIRNRVVRVVLVGLLFLGTIFATGWSLAPQVQEQTKIFAENWDKYLVDADVAAHKFLQENPEFAKWFERNEPAAAGTGEQQAPSAAPKKPEPIVSDFLKQLLGFNPEQETTDAGKEALTRERIQQLGKWGEDLLGYASSFLLAMLFSFLMVLDLPKIARGIGGLRDTKIGFIYDEVADSIATFGRVMGRALGAQLAIAVLNTVLTAIGIWVLGLPNAVFLSTIVFLCSFIPVAGVFISSTPICLLSLQAGGFPMMLLAIGLILLIHAIETYILNPRIYGHHMRMNPVLVLIVLTVGGKLFGVWGLILGIPVVNYVFRYAVRYPKDQPNDLQTASAAAGSR